MKWLGRIALGLGVVLLALVAFGWWILESSGVAIVETTTPDGGTRETHVWYAEVDDAIWLEAGRPIHPWYLDIQRDPRLVLRADDIEGEFEAATVPGRRAHDYIRGLLREKYGLRDEILGWLIDTSQSIAVRLDSEPGEVPDADPPPVGP